MMSSHSDTDQYTAFAMALHWLMAVLILAIMVLGFYMADLPWGDTRTFCFVLHKNIGMTLFLILLVRIGWRIRHPAPAWPAGMPLWQCRLAWSIHLLFYLLLLLQPLLGYLSSSFSGYSTKFWGIALPHWGWKQPNLNELFSQMHEGIALLLCALIVVHLLGAFAHLYRRDHPNMLRRMLPGK